MKLQIPIHLLFFAQAQFWQQHWNETNYAFSGSGGDALTVTQTECEEAFVQVTDRFLNSIQIQFPKICK